MSLREISASGLDNYRYATASVNIVTPKLLKQVLNPPR